MDPQTADALTCMCGRDQRANEGHTMALTAEDQQAYQDKGIAPPTSLWYCSSCYRVLQHPEHGPRLLQGRFMQVLMASGMPIGMAEAKSESYYRKLHDARIQRP